MAPVTEPEYTPLTDSHVLAQVAREVETCTGAEVSDLGWNQQPDEVENPLVAGLDNEDLWLLIRRFNQQIHHVKEYEYPLTGKLDLNIAEEEEFSPGKLRANMERLYVTIGLSAISIAKHVARLRSWRETRRTSFFCAVYLAAWLLDLLVPTLLALTLLLIVYPPARGALFPPAPLALVHPLTGALQKPRAGVLGSTDTATGCPEQYKGEAAEAEAKHFVTSLASVVIASPNPGDGAEGGVEGAIPEPAALVIEARSAQASSEATPRKGTHEKAKAPMETAVWDTLRPILNWVGGVTDTYERFANALAPTRPFHPYVHRMRVAGVLGLALVVSLRVTAYMFVKALTFGVGVVLFGGPVVCAGKGWLDRRFPHWETLLELRSTLLKGVPTNAQLALTLLRIGEANKTPLPPPPSGRNSEYPPPDDESVQLNDDNLRAAGDDAPMGATPTELAAAFKPDPHAPEHLARESDQAQGKSPSPSSGNSKLVNLLKKGVRGVTHTTLGADRIKATAGSGAARRRRGVLARREGAREGPVEFVGRWEGRRGRVYVLTAEGAGARVAFSLEGTHNPFKVKHEEVKPLWSIPVSEIKELRKVGSLGWKTRLVVGWALEREVADGLEIGTRGGEVKCLTAMVGRDELFNRLVAVGGQRWVAW